MNKAFEILMEQHRSMLLTYTTALCYGDRHTAEDIVQETCLAARRQLEKFRSGENFAAWLRGIARNKVLEQNRTSTRRRCVTESRIIEGIEEVYGVLDAQPIDEESWHSRMSRWLEECIASLSDHFKAAIERVYRQFHRHLSAGIQT